MNYLAEAGALDGIIKVIINSFLKPLPPILIGLAMLAFFWGMFTYLWGDLGEKGQIEKAKSLMLWSVIVIFVMFSVWGIVAVVRDTFFGSNPSNTPPTINDYGLKSPTIYNAH